MRLSAIVAMARNRVIGANNALPWRLKADLARFKALTMGHTLIVGRKTFESIGRPLPGRRMVVVSRNPDVGTVGSLQQALDLAAADSEVFIAGGASLYRESLPLISRLYLTLIDADFEGDTYFPTVDLDGWATAADEPHAATADFPHPFRFLVLEPRCK